MKNIAFIYPGQGAQKAGMGEDFYNNSPIAKEVFDCASDVLNMDMKQLCFTENDKLNETEYTQAALLTTSIAIKEVILNLGIMPNVSAGLSLGEYCAINTAGALNFEDSVKLVRKRGIFMQNAVPDGIGAMSAVLGMNVEQIDNVLKDIDGVWVANYNCPGQIVISGYADKIKSLSSILKENGARRVVELKVSGPFHTPLLKEAGKNLEKELKNVKLQDLKIPYVTNVTAKYIKNIDMTTDLLVQQVSSSVKWEQSVREMISNGIDIFVEIGPGNTLAGFMKKIDKNVKVINIEKYDDLEKLPV